MSISAVVQRAYTVFIGYTKTLSLILMSIFYNNNRAINYLSLRVESTTVCVQETPKTIELMLEFECLSTKLNAKMRKILSGCTYYKY